MRTKIVLWGNDEKQEKILIAVELLVEDVKVKVYTFPLEVATEDFTNAMMKDWRNDKEVAFPEGHQEYSNDLSLSEPLLPAGITAEREDVVQRAQTEWQFIVLSQRLKHSFDQELDDFKERVKSISEFDHPLWEDLKSFWNKVQDQVKERNLFKEHVQDLRDTTNKLFDELKKKRRAMDDAFEKKSKEYASRFEEELNEIKQKVEDGLSLQPIFDELKKIQSRFKDSPLSQGDRSKVWTKLDTLFKTVKEKRYGGGGTTAKGKNAFERLQRRYEGLLQAIQKMDRSIERDKKDLNFENQRIAETQGQLEAQIRQAKIQMIEERIRSKGEKLQEMHQTREVLEQRMSKENERLAEQAEKERIEKAKQEIKDKIAKEIKDAAQAREEELGDKLEHAVALIHEDDVPAVPAQEKPEPTSVPEVEEPSKEPDTTPGTPDEPVSSGSTPDVGVKEEAPKESFFESISDTISESLEDLGDTVKAVAKVVGERIEDAIGDIIDRDEEE
ncbi:MAG TPA: hypothetical protein P5275_13965 [Saprospiraceae bacterium]|nr:hypothetical protein [Saprospiraceae bacterium]HPG08105.1 hypothetical protein [Saprospiraceae bacterium]HRV85973.1 hypothetical protein [Saprospiraceae bacterium]